MNQDGEVVEPDGVDVYDVATQERVTFSGDGWGWTSRGSLFRVDGTSLEICDPRTGTCTTETGPEIGSDVRLGGNAYES